jgi:hypothetical protein
MDRIDTIEVPRTLPRPADAGDIAAVLGAICSRRPRRDVPLGVLRDRVLFETAHVCGARASEVCGMYVEDLDLHPDDEHARLHGKGGTVRTVLLDDRGYVALLRLYLARSGYTSGPLFRASINGQGGPLSYDAAHNRWKKYCAAAGTAIGIHQLRHAHATELKVSRIAGIAMHPGAAGCIGCITAGPSERRLAGTAAARDPRDLRIIGRATRPTWQPAALVAPDASPPPETDVRAAASSPVSHAARRRAVPRTWPPRTAVADRRTLLAWTCDTAGQIRTGNHQPGE